jgi:aspartate carbamoyltransferase catalytic subunit
MTGRRPGRDLCEIADLSLAEVCELLASAARLVPIAEGAGPRSLDVLRGAQVLSVFNEPSTRTRLSFEVAARRLGAEVVNFNADRASSAAKGETERDSLRNLDAMGFDALVARDSRDGAPRAFTEIMRARVVNAGDGTNEHPTQALLDALTIIEAFGRAPGPQALAGLTIAVCGDVRHGRVAHSDLKLFRLLGARCVVAGPGDLAPPELAATLGASAAPSLDEALAGADVAMMLRIQRERLAPGVALPDGESYHAAWGLTSARAAALPPGAIIMHPGPINRGVELADAVADGPRSKILRQVTLGIAVRMAVLAFACGVKLP